LIIVQLKSFTPKTGFNKRQLANKIKLLPNCANDDDDVERDVDSLKGIGPFKLLENAWTGIISITSITILLLRAYAILTHDNKICNKYIILIMN
jgi:hypothetical protein